MVDATDRAILRILEQDARISFNELSERIGLSKTPSWARVRELEKRKVILGYRAEIDSGRLGLALHAFVQVTISATHHDEFEQAAIDHRSVLECYTTAGQGDYLLHVLVSDVNALDALLRTEISRMPGVQRLTTTVGMKTIKARASIVGCATRS